MSMIGAATPSRYVGLDIGTTNSAVAVVTGSDVALAEFATAGGTSPTFPSVLYFERHRHAAGTRVRCHAGPDAITRYLEAEHEGRLMQSLKAYLGDRRFERTSVFARTYTLADLIASIVKQMLASADRPVEPVASRVVVGRPVHFTNAAGGADDEFALGRMLDAVVQSGFADVLVEYEPVAAAYSYETRLGHDEVILIGDFGGGTSDFSILRVGPTVRRHGRTPDDILGNDGVAVAGDAFDRQLVRHLVAPHLGMGSEYRSSPHKRLPVPSWPYEHLERWHRLSFLNNDGQIEALERLRRHALKPDEILAFIHVIRGELGYRLHEAVRRTKFALSSDVQARFEFTTDAVSIVKRVTRSDFEGWIGRELAEIARCVDGLMDRTGVAAGDIDHVFLTGGSSFVPAVRRIFLDRFDPSKITGGAELTSVATGLALRAAEHWGGLPGARSTPAGASH
jgi:hypothetical chaperone protein